MDNYDKAKQLYDECQTHGDIISLIRQGLDAKEALNAQPQAPAGAITFSLVGLAGDNIVVNEHPLYQASEFGDMSGPYYSAANVAAVVAAATAVQNIVHQWVGDYRRTFGDDMADSDAKPIEDALTRALDAAPVAPQDDAVDILKALHAACLELPEKYVQAVGRELDAATTYLEKAALR